MRSPRSGLSGVPELRKTLRDSEMTNVPGFLTKTFEIFSSPEYSDCCGWGSNGETIIIRKVSHLLEVKSFCNALFSSLYILTIDTD